MKERTNIPASSACGLWEILLADALDGLLSPGDEAAFQGHLAHCPACAALFEDARKGREWLEFLGPEPEVPSGLLNKILEHTGPGQAASQGLEAAGGNGLPVPQVPIPVSLLAWQRPGLMGSLRRYAEPRLLMTAAMAFFSIALTLNLTNIPLRQLRLASLRPSAVRSFMERRLTTASTPIVRYYDHSRLVNEVEARVRELRRNTQIEGQDEEMQKKPAPATPGESKKLHRQYEVGSGSDPLQQAETPSHLNSLEDLDVSLNFQTRSALAGGSAMAVRERSMAWTA